MSDYILIPDEDSGDFIVLRLHPEGLELYAADLKGSESSLDPSGYVFEEEDLIRMKDLIEVALYNLKESK